MKVVHAASKYFDKKGLLGGGERYAVELAKATCAYADTTLVAFGEERMSTMNGPLKVEIYPVVRGVWKKDLRHLFFNWQFTEQFRDADIIHCHQIEINITNQCIIYGKLFGKKVVATDHGAYNSSLGLNRRFHLEQFLDHFFLNSEYCARRYAAHKDKTTIIYGGVDAEKFKAADYPRERKVIFVGRLLPHKGINYLVEGVAPADRLHVLGMPYSQEFAAYLKQLANGKNVLFREGISDKDLVREYQTALVTVLPSVERDYQGKIHLNPELLGLTLLESMACGTPVICARTAAMPEVVEDGVDGFIVPPNDPAALGDRVKFLLDNPDKALAMGAKGRQKVMDRFVWPKVSEVCVLRYKMLVK